MSDTTAAERQQTRYEAAATEAKWRARWQETELYKVNDDDPRPKWYSLTMYPYPSGVLHVGHWYAFAVPDSFARFKRMQGFNVLFPMGFDAFGLPAENAAIKHNIHPGIWTYENIDQMRGQYDLMGAMIDWSRELASSDPDYYRWNQWIFLKMMEKGIAYRKDGAVWWCPKDQTVLANEQVLDGNICERCGTEVYKRDLEQWYFKITDYADELLDELDGLDWPERVKTMQRNWIGRSAGARLSFKLETGDSLDVFTTRPDTVYGATFMVIAPEHPLVAKLTTDEQRDAVEAYVKTAKNATEIERLSTDEAKSKTGVFTGSYAVNPLTDERIPVWIADYVLMTYGTGAIMAVPSGDERDFRFARTFDLPIRVVVQPEGVELDPATMTEAYTGPGVMVNSGVFNGRKVPEAVPEIIEYLNKEGRGQAEITFRLRDWLISRQRYWGTPIPVVYCDNCGMQPVPYEQLPVLLPLDAEFTPTGQSPLVSHEAFLNTTCPKCDGPARRETDTLDTFMDSSWYWYRYTSPGYEDGPFDPELARMWTPVDLYSGGIEHAILHLLYARFFTKVLRGFGMLEHGEPFTRLRNQGMILAEEGTKMSKSRGTQVAPDELALQYGADALRLHLMFLGPWDQGGPWNSRGIVGMERFIRRAYQLVIETNGKSFDGAAPPADVDAVVKSMHKTIKRVTADITGFHFNTMVAGMIEFVNELTKRKDGPEANTADWKRAIETLVLLMAPSAPYVAEEMWEMLGNEYSVHQHAWPDYIEAFTHDDVVEIAVQVNGKVRDKVVLAADASEEDALTVARASEKVQQFAGDTTPKRVIYVPGRLLNIIV